MASGIQGDGKGHDACLVKYRMGRRGDGRAISAGRYDRRRSI